jgi:hypothetical protein
MNKENGTKIRIAQKFELNLEKKLPFLTNFCSVDQADLGVVACFG